MRSHWSLVVFTLLIQSTAGGVWFVQGTLLLDPGRLGESRRRFQIIVVPFVASGAVLAVMVAATGHLGNPLAGFHAIGNLKYIFAKGQLR